MKRIWYYFSFFHFHVLIFNSIYDIWKLNLFSSKNELELLKISIEELSAQYHFLCMQSFLDY